MRHFLLLLFALILSWSSFSQNKEQLSQLSFDALLDTIQKYQFSDIEKALDAAEAYTLKGKRENDKEKEWLGMQSSILVNVNFRKYKLANEQAENALEFVRSNKLPDLEMQVLLLLGDLHGIVTTVDQQLFYYNELLQLAEKKNDPSYREYALTRIARVHDISGDSQKALNLYKKSLEYFKHKPLDSLYTQIKKNSTLVILYSSMALAHLKLEHIDSAKLYNLEIKKFQEKELDSCYGVYAYLLEGEIAYEEEKFDEARENYEKAYSICPSEYDLMALNKAYALGKIEVGAKNYKRGIEILQSALDDYQVTAAEEGFMRDYYEKLAEAYKNTGNYEKASFYYEKYLVSKTEYTKLKEDAKESFLKRERANFKRDFDAVVSEKESSKSKLNYVLLGASIIVLILLFLLLKFYRNKRANEIKFRDLLAKIEAAPTPDEIIDTKDAVLEEKNTSDVPEGTKQQILSGLKKLEKQEYFLKQECNSYNVAKKIGTNTSYLSKVINSHYGKNFNTYINDLRINYTIIRLKNDVIFRSYSIQSIAEEVGYKSADSFTKYFKKDTGLNPSFYIKEIKNIA
ncbi:helix-turn-helix domain-containing protein [Aequorivita sp. H23M31]|uniref:Helix-turn-helix domain-containing protein n=1 Tax=Aequorivita ciconiae TaxID=2494375 RepID=A0A410G481_9FLAO|nr:helix-turn-helix domain-containing protein [Aequorivita sp. H23M31]QAA82080.1 helix-turn-helix domain-containing protein [Aequorivita sp. H23M31]